tara:strand:+ start:161 stop:397 length:237 start_codon:yes stop_codon:yes gene_type:complete
MSIEREDLIEYTPTQFAISMQIVQCHNIIHELKANEEIPWSLKSKYMKALARVHNKLTEEAEKHGLDGSGPINLEDYK